MTLEQQVGQLLWCGWGDAPEPDPDRYNDHARYLVEELGAGALVLFARNVGDPEQVARLTDELRSHAAIPPLIGIDQEGGRVCRLALPGLTFPGNMALGALDDTERTRDVCRAIGEQLAALGIDIDFAPAVDVNNNPLNPVIGVRAFGDDPKLVARHGVAAVQGFREAGVLPVLKHFPGHGDTDADSHFELPVQPAGRSRLDQVELVPFLAALKAGAPAVMSTHILFPRIDPELPATLSPRILTGLLREELGFDGLIITDCLEMRGIADHWGPEEAAVLALQAGADALLVCHTWETQTRMRDAVLKAVREGRLSEERIGQSVRRVQRARELTAGVRERPRNPALVGAEKYRELEASVSEASLKLLPGSRPLRGWKRSDPVIVSGAEIPVRRLAPVLAAEGFTVEARPGGEPGTGPGSQLIWMALPDEPFPDGRPPVDFARRLVEHPRVLVIGAREPYCLGHYPEELPRLATWGTLPPHVEALARWLKSQCSEG